MPGPQIAVTFSAEGDDVTRAVRDLSRQIQTLGRTSRRSARGSSELGRSFRNIALRTIGIIATVRAFDALANAIRSSVQAGIAYNETIETATLAIASLITAQARLTDETGRQLDAQEALNAALAISEDQVRALRIAGIQTAATTEELVDAFQQAVGAGIAAGLNLDEIRQVTIRIAQAAGALGVPYRQLNEEIRSILSGIIDQNTRIAKALGLTNQQLQQAKEAGRLAEFLLERFEAFGVAGDRIVQTFSALRSNVQEAAQLLAGDAFRPFFERLRDEGLDAVEQIFEFETAEIDPDFAGFVQAAQRASAEIGELVAEGIRRGLAAFRELSEFLEENREEVEGIVDATGDLLTAVGELSTEMAKVVGQIIKAGVETGAIEQTIETITDLVRFIAENRALVVVVLGALAAGITALATAILGPQVVAVIAIATGVGALAARLDSLADSQREARTEAARLRQEQTRQQIAFAETTVEAGRLVDEYENIRKKLDEGTLSADEVVKAQERLKEIERELIELGPDFQSAIVSAAQGHRDIASAIREEVEAREALLITQAAVASAELADVQAEIARLEAQRGRPTRQAPGIVGNLVATGLEAERTRERLAELQDQEAELEARSEALADAFNQLRQDLGLDIDPIADDEDGASALQAVKAQAAVELAEIKARLKEAEAELKASLDRNEISFREYFDSLQEAQTRAIDAEIEIQRRIRDATTDQLQRAQIDARIIELQSERSLAVQKAEEELRQELEKLEDDLQKAQIRLLEATGEGAAAARQKIEEEFEELTARLEAEGDEAGLELVRRLFNVTIARAQADELERIISDTQRRIRDRIEEIELAQQSGAISAAEARRQQAQALREIRDEIGRLLPALRAVAELTGNPEDIARVRQLENEFRRLTLQIETLEDTLIELKRGAFDAVQRSLEDFFTTGIEESESLADAFRRMALSIVESLQRVIARMIALRIATAVFQGLGIDVPGLASGGQVEGFAGGGLVRGPGGPTQDRVLARLSPGEFVMRAAAVKEIGLDVLEQMNQGVPRARTYSDLLPRFAEGGLVEPATRRPASGGTSRLQVEHSDDVVMRVLESSRGTRVVLRTVSENRSAILQALGLR